MANSTIIYACTENGLAVFNKPGTLPEWLPPRMTLEARPVQAAWAEPGPPIKVLAAAGPEAQGNQGELLLSESGGRSWEARLEARVTALFATEDDPPRYFAGMESGGLAGSVDGGNTWGIFPGFEDGGTTRLLLPVEPDSGRLLAFVEYFPGDSALFEGTPEDGDWRKLALQHARWVCRDDASGDLYASGDEGVQVSADGGFDWVLLPGSPGVGTRIVAIPGPAGAAPAVLVGTERGIALSADAGMTWREVALPGEGSVTAFARDPERRDRLYAGTSTGLIFESGNRGAAWQAVNGEPVGPVLSLFVSRI